MSTEEKAPGTRKLILAGVAIAIPLAAVAVYFVIFDQPPPPSRAAPGPSSSAQPGSPGGPSGQAALPPDHPPIGGAAGGPTAPGSSQPPAATPRPGQAGHPQTGAMRPVRIPDLVRGKWGAIKLRVEQKGGGKAPQFFTVALGGQLDIPGSGLRVMVGDFLPALQVSGNEVTSATNEPTNPAVLVTVTENGREAFKGWLFSKFPDMQPFEHPTYRITLVEGIPKS
jgi:hypothetical protein